MTTTATHDPAPLFQNADNCDHPEPRDDASRQWSGWDADHPHCRDIGERVCELTPIGFFCPACTDVARQEFGAAGWWHIAAENCVHAPVIT